MNGARRERPGRDGGVKKAGGSVAAYRPEPVEATALRPPAYATGPR